MFFAFAMQCKGSKTVLTYRFAKDMVSGTIENLIENAPKYSSSILTMMRRIGECPGQQKPGNRPQGQRPKSGPPKGNPPKGRPGNRR